MNGEWTLLLTRGLIIFVAAHGGLSSSAPSGCNWTANACEKAAGKTSKQVKRKGEGSHIKYVQESVQIDAAAISRLCTLESTRKEAKALKDFPLCNLRSSA